LVTLEARAGKEADAEAFLKSAQPLALDEKGTLKWYAFKLGPGRFGIFDTFANEAGLRARLNVRVPGLEREVAQAIVDRDARRDMCLFQRYTEQRRGYGQRGVEERPLGPLNPEVEANLEHTR